MVSAKIRMIIRATHPQLKTEKCHYMASNF